MSFDQLIAVSSSKKNGFEFAPLNEVDLVAVITELDIVTARLMASVRAANAHHVLCCWS